MPPLPGTLTPPLSTALPLIHASPDVPLSIAAPAAAATLAYLNARWSLWYDLGLIKGLMKVAWRSRSAERAGHLNLFYILEHYALTSATADRPFVVYNGRTWSFHEAYLLALRYGTWFKKVHKVKPREIVALDFMNSSHFVFLIFGLWSIGAVPALINYNLSGKPLTHSVRVSTARLLIVDEEVRGCFPPDQLETFASSNFRDGKGPVQVVFFNPDVEAQILQTPAAREDDKVRGSSVPRDMALLIYTSGTTGLPKPAIVSWKKCWTGSVFTSNWLSLTQADRFFTVGCLEHRCPVIADNTIVHAPLPLVRRHPGSCNLSDGRVNVDHWPEVLCQKFLERCSRE